MIESRTGIVAGDNLPSRLDAWIRAQFPRSPRARILEAVERGDIRVNGRPSTKGRSLHAGDRVEVIRLFEDGDPFVIPEPGLPLSVLAADARWIGLDKPAGMPAHPLTPYGRGTLANALAARYPECADAGDTPAMGGILHRLDTGTSGVTLAARDADAYRILRDQFQHRRVEKIYTAWVAGDVSDAGRVDSWLAHVPGDRGRMRSLADPCEARGERAMRAATEFEPVERRGAHTLLRVTIRTGVTHQIRCHLASIGHPVAGDAVYAPPCTPALPRHMLHAESLTFLHPETGRPVQLRAPVPCDFAPVANCADARICP